MNDSKVLNSQNSKTKYYSLPTAAPKATVIDLEDSSELHIVSAVYQLTNTKVYYVRGFLFSKKPVEITRKYIKFHDAIYISPSGKESMTMIASVYDPNQNETIEFLAENLDFIIDEEKDINQVIAIYERNAMTKVLIGEDNVLGESNSFIASILNNYDERLPLP